jgi:U3 small nucleolar RNA-associated protein 18
MEEKRLTSKLFGNLGEEPLVDFIRGERETCEETWLGMAAAAAVAEEASEPGGRGSSGVGAEATTARKEEVDLRTAWEDPDDAQTIVNVAKVARLRKLRSAETEAELAGGRYVQRIRTQHQRINQRTAWADFSQAEEDIGSTGTESAEQDPNALTRLLREGGALVDEDDGLAGSGRMLPKGMLEATRVHDANAAEPSKAVIRSVQFHPNGSLLLTAGLDKSVRLFDVDGTHNPKVQGVFFDDLPIHRACFSGDGSQVVVAGRRRYFYVYDLQGGAVERVAPLVGRDERSLESFVESPVGADHPMLAFLGADGHVPLVSLKSRSCIGAVKMNGTARSAVFSADGTRLLTAGGDGTVYVWDLRNQRRCVERIVDDGALNVTSLAISPTGGHLGVGSDSGVVNVYDNAGLGGWSANGIDGRVLARQGLGVGGSIGMQRAVRREPVRALMNLTTAVDTTTFNGDGQILAVSSRLKRDALRLVHIPSCTVFSNWPSSKTPLHYVWCTAFSPTGGYLAVGNARGRALLYRIHAYGLE